MTLKYLCPKCRTSINVGDKIILAGKTDTGLKGIVVLKSQLGNYITSFSEDFTVFEGNKIRLSCPICHKSLSTKKSKNIAKLNVVDDKNNEFTIYFSQIYGERCTYKTEGKQIIESYGDHKEKYRPDWLIEEL